MIIETNSRVTNEFRTLANQTIHNDKRNIENSKTIWQKRSSHQDHNTACYECSSFPPEDGSLDEILGSCPGWRRSAKRYGVGGSGNTVGSSLYDGCMTIILSNGSVTNGA